MKTHQVFSTQQVCVVGLHVNLLQVACAVCQTVLFMFTFFDFVLSVLKLLLCFLLLS